MPSKRQKSQPVTRPEHIAQPAVTGKFESRNFSRVWTLEPDEQFWFQHPETEAVMRVESLVIAYHTFHNRRDLKEGEPLTGEIVTTVHLYGRVRLGSKVWSKKEHTWSDGLDVTMLPMPYQEESDRLLRPIISACTV